MIKKITSEFNIQTRENNSIFKLFKNIEKKISTTSNIDYNATINRKTFNEWKKTFTTPIK